MLLAAEVGICDVLRRRFRSTCNFAEQRNTRNLKLNFEQRRYQQRQPFKNGEGGGREEEEEGGGGGGGGANRGGGETAEGGGGRL